MLQESAATCVPALMIRMLATPDRETVPGFDVWLSLLGPLPLHQLATRVRVQLVVIETKPGAGRVYSVVPGWLNPGPGTG